MIGQMVRNAVEFGIESPERRSALKKPEQGTLVVEFVDRQRKASNSMCRTMAAASTAKGITDIAVRKGLLDGRSRR